MNPNISIAWMKVLNLVQVLFLSQSFHFVDSQVLTLLLNGLVIPLVDGLLMENDFDRVGTTVIEDTIVSVNPQALKGRNELSI